MSSNKICPQCSAFIAIDATTCPYCERSQGNPGGGPRAGEAGAILGGLIPANSYITYLLLIANFGIWIACIVFSSNQGKSDAWMSLDMRTLILLGGKFRPEIIPGDQWWRLITASFLHGGLLHFVCNAPGLLAVGAVCEEKYRASRYILIYLMSSIAGFGLSLYLSPASVSVGASAPLMGLVGALMAMALIERTEEHKQAQGFYMMLVLSTMLIGILLPALGVLFPKSGLANIRVDHAAHIGGFVGGFLTALVVGLPGSGPKRMLVRDWISRSAATVMVAIAIFGFLRMYQFFERLASTQAYRGQLF